MITEGHKAEDENVSYHKPVLLQACIDGLKIKADGVYVDCTFGGGGHSRAILEQLGEKGKLIAFDQDKDAVANVPEDKRLVFVPQNFKYLSRFLRLHEHGTADGILVDLGVSSHQFDEGERGFSTRYDGPLDMRMDIRESLTAAEILNTYEETTLHKLFEIYGEVTNSKSLAKAIVEGRSTEPFSTIEGFKTAMYDLVKGNPKKYFAQVFQALRIAVNKEIEVLEEMLEQVVQSLKPGGRIAIISFHSLEDRVVKNFFKTGSTKPVEADEVYGNRPECPFKIITKKPITASPQELQENNRSRSAKLRIAEKK